MLDIYKLTPKQFNFVFLDNCLLDYFKEYGSYPVCIYLDRDQMEDFLNIMTNAGIIDLCYRGIPVKYYIEKTSAK